MSQQSANRSLTCRPASPLHRFVHTLQILLIHALGQAMAIWAAMLCRLLCPAVPSPPQRNPTESSPKRNLTVSPPQPKLAQAPERVSPGNRTSSGESSAKAKRKLRAELEVLRVSELRWRAKDAGVTERELDAAQDSDTPKPSMIELIIAKQATSASAKQAGRGAGPALAEDDIEQIMKLDKLAQEGALEMTDEETAQEVDALLRRAEANPGDMETFIMIRRCVLSCGS